MSISPIRVASFLLVGVVAFAVLSLAIAMNVYNLRTQDSDSPLSRIALVAPFEGRDRAVGYEALTAARVAFDSVNDTRLELLPIDAGDGQTEERLRALAGDPLVRAVLLVGISPDEGVTAAAADLPVLLIPPGDGNAAQGGRVVISRDSSAPAHLLDLYEAADQYAPPPTALAARVWAAASQIIGAVRMAGNADDARTAVYERLTACCE
jgi:hypothetical protein